VSSKTHISISIPYDLASYAVCQRNLVNKYETNQIIKALDTWLVLKHETTSGTIQQWNAQKQWLFTLCKCSETIFRHRLRVLQDLGLLSIAAGSLHVCSWDKVAAKFSWDINKYFTVQYNINDKQRLQEWIIAAEIEDNKHRQEYALLTKLNKNPESYNEIIAAAIASGAERDKLKSASYLLSWMRVLYTSGFAKGSDIHNVLIDFRPDNNRSVRGIANAWNCKHPVTISYWKKIMQDRKIIDISKLQIESEQRARNKHCRVLWLKGPAQTLLCLCDQIEILKPWIATNPLFFLPAA
jgi:hypothetical protein